MVVAAADLSDEDTLLLASRRVLELNQLRLQHECDLLAFVAKLPVHVAAPSKDLPMSSEQALEQVTAHHLEYRHVEVYHEGDRRHFLHVNLHLVFCQLVQFLVTALVWREANSTGDEESVLGL